ncbi:MAG: aryl-sulfate sulfotransferase [Myxococcota bacterium]
MMKLRLQFLVAALAVALAAAGCGDPDGDNNANNTNNMADGGDVDAGMDVETGTDSDSDTDTSTLEITSQSVVENPNNVLSAVALVETSEPTSLSFEVASADHTFSVESSGDLSDSHDLFIPGMRAETDYTITVTATNADGDTVDGDPVDFTTSALPDDFPPVEVTVNDAASVQRGITIFDVFRFAPDIDAEWGYLVGVDEEGHVVWYYNVGGQPQDVSPTSDGTLIMTVKDEFVREIDMRGETLNEWTAEDLGLDTVHHEITELPNGNFAVLSTEMQTIDGYDDGNGGTTSHDVVGDVAVEFSRDGTIVHEHSMFDVLDPMRKALEGFDAGYWNRVYDTPNGTKDWTHGNAIILDESDNSFILSLRHQDWLVKIDRETGDLVWRMGREGDFDLTAGEWQYHQHAPMLVGGNILLYDNGNARPNTDPADLYSRAVEFSLDATNADPGADTKGTAEQVWEFAGETPFYSPYICDADQLANGNVLVTDGGRLEDKTVPLTDADNRKWARIVEVTKDADPQIVWELKMDDGADTGGYAIYRADRIESLTNPVVVNAQE